MAINFFRKYPKNIVEYADVVGVISGVVNSDTNKIKDKDKRKEELEVEFQDINQLLPLELKPEASSACRKNLKSSKEGIKEEIMEKYRKILLQKHDESSYDSKNLIVCLLENKFDESSYGKFILDKLINDPVMREHLLNK